MQACYPKLMTRRTIIIVFLILLCVGGLYKVRTHLGNSPLQTALQSPISAKASVIPSPDFPIPSTAQHSTLLSVPFISQAPNTNWDALHEDACEEASIIMVQHFLKKTSIVDLSQQEQEIQGLVAYETDKSLGGSISLQTLAKLAKDSLGLPDSHIVQNPTPLQIRNELDAGHPVLIPAAGRLLHNPHYKAPGPLYHALVIIGYAGDTFITNDPGTKAGSGYAYPSDVLMQAIANWDDATQAPGAPAYLVVEG
jgi:hypothetical protein